MGINYNEMDSPSLLAITLTYMRNMVLFNENVRQLIELLQRDQEAPEIHFSMIPIGIVQTEEEEEPRRITTQEEFNRTTEVVPIVDGTATEACTICYTAFDSVLEVRKLKDVCNHKFHTHCLQEWLRRDCRCPLCRASAIE